VSVEPPADYLVLVSRAVTTAAGTPPSVTLDRGIGDGYESVVVSGRIAVGDAPTVIRRSVADPTAYAGSVLAFALRAQGIAVAERQVAGTVPADATVLLAFEGRPLADSVRLMLKYSSNPIAETLTKDLALAAGAGRADWTSGVAASRDALTQLGVDVAGLRMVDGSGLSYENRVTPRTLVSALRIARTSFAFGPELFSALPIAGLDGTLRSRASAVRGELRAKTGLLNHVAALSGEALTHGGRVVVFSVLVNGYRCGDDEAMRAIDGFAAAMIESDTGGRDAGAAP
jgi:D-alanyl-D-alanine carboxypeptidase/D-alanyl-D-alanine-endopeptidase (penicillin-binding protein 4)